MKKVKIVVSETGYQEQHFALFKTAEQLYSWLCSEDEDPSNFEGAYDITIRNGEHLEVEWLGCEIVYEGNLYTILNYVQVVKVSKPKNSQKEIATIWIGWTTPEELPFKQGDNDEIIVTRLSKDDKQFDIAGVLKEI